MTANRSRARFGVFTVLILLLAFAAGTGARLNASAAAGQPLQNLGFETADLTGWSPVDAPDEVKAVLKETKAEFAAYGGTPDSDIEVTPNVGDWMVRLGTPKAISSSQPDGINSISQTFRPSASTLSFAARLFSWESRPNTDKVEFSFTGANTSTIKFGKVEFITKANKVAASCAGGSNVCSSWIDVGNRGDYLSSLGSNPVDGWVTITVTGLPTDVDVTFKASIGSTQNNALASWLYLDSANTPPIAKFEHAFPTVSLSGGVDGARTTKPLEGSPIQFRDLSTDPDPGDSIVAWEWTIKKDGQPALKAPLTTQNPFFVPHDNGMYEVTLKVWDTGGATDTEVTTIEVLNAPPLVNALDIEAIEDAAFPVVGRFTDAGWTDAHTAAWNATCVSPLATVQEDHAPALGTGKVTGSETIVSPGAFLRDLCVNDGVESKKDPFTVTVLPDTAETRAGLGSHTEFGSARTVTIDGSYLGILPVERTRSVFEIKWPGAGSSGDQELPGGAEILVNLKDLPADYDLILVATDGQQSLAPTGYAFSGYAFSGFAFSGYAFSDLPNLVSPYAAGYAFSELNTTGYAFSGIQRAAYGEAGYAFSDASAAGYAFSGYAFSGYAFSGYAFSDLGGFEGDAFAPYAVAGYAFSPISQMGFTGLDSSNASPSDVSLSELGLGQIPATASIVGYSANRGKGGETVLARIDSPGTRLYAIVVGNNGSFSPETFRLDVEGSMTITSAALAADEASEGHDILLGGTCAPRTVSSDLPAGYAPLVYTSAGFNRLNTAPQTLFVTQQGRLANLNPGDAAGWTTLQGDLQALANHTSVNGKIISVDAAPFTAWDNTPCSIEAANDVSAAIRTRIQAELQENASIDYVVILGDDDVIPFRRVPDQVSIGNERSYLASSFLAQGTPLYASVAGGYNLTDDCNVDALPTPWQGRELCVPDKVISRLVETPSEIAAQAEAFHASNGLLDAATQKTGLVAGYDFFTDGSLAVAEALEAFLDPVNALLIRDDWTAAELRCHLLGIGDPLVCQPSSVADANAHFTHYAGLSANGFDMGDYQDVLTSSDVSAATAGANLDRLAGKLVYTIGCHAGFSAPDRAINFDPNIGVDARLDFPQAFARARAVYIASTGYGIGDDSGIAGTERLIVLYAEELGKGKSAGQALVDAKRYYLSSLPAASVYDEKSSINLTLYGLPMYSLGVTAGTSPLTAAVEALSTESVVETIGTTLKNPAPPQGNYYVATGGDAAAPPYRPLQPRKVFPVTYNEAAGPVHGILWTSGGFTDETMFNPVIARPSVEWEEDPTEPQVCYDGFWPSEIFRVNTLDNAQGGLEQTVVVTPGQFRCDGIDGSGQVYGTQRRFTVLGWEVLRSTVADLGADVTAPSLTQFDLDLSDDTLKPLTLKISALDPVVGAITPSGIERIVVLRIKPGATNTPGTVEKIADTKDTGSLGGVPSGTFDINVENPGNDRLVIQIVDAAGNVGVYTAKGPGLRILDVTLTATPETFSSLPVSLAATVDVDFDNDGIDDEPMVGPVTYFWNFGDGSDTKTTVDQSVVEHPFPATGDEYTVTVRVTDSNGGIGIARVVVRNYCRDSSGDATIDPSVALSQGDFIGCRVGPAAAPAPAGYVTITLRLAAPISDEAGTSWPAKIRYTVSVGAKGKGSTKNLSYREGSITGVKSLTVKLSNDTISFTFDPKDVGVTGNSTLVWSATTQGGIAATQGAGSLDRIPDAGVFEYIP